MNETNHDDNEPTSAPAVQIMPVGNMFTVVRFERDEGGSLDWDRGTTLAAFNTPEEAQKYADEIDPQ